MKRQCVEYRDRVVELAEGKLDADARSHVDQCPECQQRLAQFQVVLSVASETWVDAPESLIQAAISSFVPVPQRRFSLFSSTLAGTGARRTTSDQFQTLLKHEDLEVRLSYQKESDGWIVRGRSNVPIDSLDIAGALVTGSRFEFRVARLSEAEFELNGVIVPAPLEDSVDDARPGA